MFNYKRTLLVLVLLVVAVISVGCGSASEEAVKETSVKTEEISDDTRMIKHAMGETEITGTPKRVVTLYQGATDVAIALGIKPVGVVESWVQKPKYNYLKEDLKDIPLVGLETQPNLEEIAKLNPDVIIASKIRHEKIYDKLNKIAPTVTHETVFKFKDTVQLMGTALNRQEKAESLLNQWEDRVKDFNKKIQAKVGDEWPIEVSVLNFRTDHARIYVTGFAGDILKELGFTRPENQRKAAAEGNVVLKLTTKESIPSMNADVFFTFVADGHRNDAEAVQKTFDEWTNHPLWKNLDAVQKNQTYLVDDVAWNMAGGYIAANDMLDQLYEHFKLENK